jgi:sugar/nucleoside kinase (ribokinase family)
VLINEVEDAMIKPETKNMDRPDVLCAGIAVMDVFGRPIDHVPDWDRLATFDHIEYHLGGCAVNTAVDLSKLGVKTGICACIGEDDSGYFIVSKLAKSKVDTSGIVRKSNCNTAYTFIMIRSDGHRRYLHHVGANAVFTETDIPEDLLRDSKVLHIGGTFLMPQMDGEPTAKLLRRAKKHGMITVLDTAYNPQVNACQLIRPTLPYLDVFLPSIEEAQLITGKTKPEEIMDEFRSYGITYLAIKLGSEGCLVCHKDTIFQSPIYKVDAVDHSGAGDSFAAGFIYGVLQNWPIQKIAKFANAVAAFCIQKVGCSTGIPEAEIVLDFISSE